MVDNIENGIILMASTPQHQHLDEGEVPSFRHQPLRLDVASIRLLDILPLGNDGIIRCNIRHSTLATPIAPKTSTNWNCAPSYTCLSYVWGSDDSMKMIMVNDERFPVRENLYSFLRMLSQKRLRAQEAKYVNGKDSIDVEACAKSIWIDALCIDQASIQERNHQVQQMGRIYSQAQEVVVWLGDDVGFDELFRFAATLTPFERRRDARQVARHIEFIYALSENTYWSRAWITQELALARAVHFIALNSSVLMESLLLMGASVKQTYGEDVFLKLYRPLREHQRGSLALNVFDNLWRYRDKACSDERDLVYSLLSMSRNGAKFQVSYQCTLIELALDVLQSCEGGPCLHRIYQVFESLGCRVQGPLPQSQLSNIKITGFVVKGVGLDEPKAACSRCVRILQRDSEDFMRVKSHETCGVCTGVVEIPRHYLEWGTYHIYCLGCHHYNTHQHKDMGGVHLCLGGPLDSTSLAPTWLLLVKGGRCSRLWGAYRAVSDLDDTSVRLQISIQLIIEILSQQIRTSDDVGLAPQLRVNDTSGAWAHWQMIGGHDRLQLTSEYGRFPGFLCYTRKDADGIAVCSRCSERRRRSGLLQQEV